MELSFRENTKTVEIWLTNEDQLDPGTDAEVRRLCSVWEGGEYTVAVFRSGNGDLFTSAEGLLLNNLAG